MEKFLDAYIKRIQPLFTRISERTGHGLASAFLAFKFGLYANAIRECSDVSKKIPDGEPEKALLKAIAIVKANAESLEISQVSGGKGTAFSESERAFVAIQILPEKAEDPDTLELDNALILIYVVALLQSPDDEDPLEEHRKFIIRTLTNYKNALGFD